MKKYRLFAQRHITALAGALACSVVAVHFPPAAAQQPEKGLISQSAAQTGNEVPLSSEGAGQPDDKGYIKEVADLLKAGNKLVEAGKYSEARARFSEALKVSPQCSGAYNGIGASYLRENNFKQAEVALRRGFDLDSNNMHILNNLGAACYHQEHFAECIVYYKLALQMAHTDDGKVEPMVNLANALADQKKIKEASEYFAEALRIKPDYAMAYTSLARMYYNTGRFDLAVENANRAIKLKPNYAMAYYHLGLSEYARKNVNEAVDALRLSYKYEKDPNYAADTKHFLDRLIANNSGGGAKTSAPDPISAERIAQLLNTKNWKEAEIAIRTMIGENGDNAILYNNLGYALAHQSASDQTYQRAIAAYRKAIELKQGPFPSAYYNLGQAYRLLGHEYRPKAEAAFRHAISDARTLRTTLPVAHNALGLLLKQKGDFKGADASYKVALAQAGTALPVIHYNRGILLEKMENTREAVREYKAYLSNARKGLNVNAAKERLRRLGVEPPA